ncbi:unnamed protein product [Chrysoparadoxa australica]
MNLKINKHRRLTKIVQVLERWAPLDTNEITTHLSNIFGVEESELKRNVGNDLKFLREESEIIPLYFNKLGKLVSVDIEPDGEIFYRIKWQLRESSTEMISGAHLLSQFQCYINCSEDLESEVKLKQGLGKSPEDFIYFYFDLNHELYHFQFPRAPHSDLSDKDQAYFALAICRSNESEEKRAQDFLRLKKDYPDISLALLSFQDPFLSAYDEEIPILLLFRKGGTISFLADANKNTVESIEIQNEVASNLLNYLQFFRNRTQTQHWTEIKSDNGFNVGSREDLHPPFLFRIKETTGFVVV